MRKYNCSNDDLVDTGDAREELKVQTSESGDGHIITSRQPPLSLKNIARIFEDVGNFPGCLSTYQALKAIIIYLTKEKMSNPNDWAKLFDENAIYEMGWNSTLIYYFGNQQKANNWFELYKKFLLLGHNRQLTESDKSTYLKKTCQWRAKWFKDASYVPITAAFLVKVFDASKRPNVMPLPQIVYEKARPVFLQNWPFWCQNLSLSDKFKDVCPNAIIGSTNIANDEMYESLLKNRTRYFLDDIDTMATQTMDRQIISCQSASLRQLAKKKKRVRGKQFPVHVCLKTTTTNAPSISLGTTTISIQADDDQTKSKATVGNNDLITYKPLPSSKLNTQDQSNADNPQREDTTDQFASFLLLHAKDLKSSNIDDINDDKLNGQHGTAQVSAENIMVELLRRERVLNQLSDKQKLIIEKYRRLVVLLNNDRELASLLFFKVRLMFLDYMKNPHDINIEKDMMLFINQYKLANH